MNIFVGPSIQYWGSRFKRVFRGLQTVDSVKIISDKFTGRSKDLVLLRCQMMMKLKSNWRIERSYCSRTCNCSKQIWAKTRRRKEEVLITTQWRRLMELRRQQSRLVVTEEEDINIFSNYKCKLMPFSLSGFISALLTNLHITCFVCCGAF
jgi:hypothetical protein